MKNKYPHAIVRDGTGQRIATWLNAPFESRKRLMKISADLNRISLFLDRMVGKPGTRWIDFQSLTDTIASMRRHIYTSAPYFRCQHCRPLDKCDVCKGEKWIPLNFIPESLSSGKRKGPPLSADLNDYLPSSYQRRKSSSKPKTVEKSVQALRSALQDDSDPSPGTHDTMESDSESSSSPNE